MNEKRDRRCPRCGGDFHCGANDAQPCACTAIALTSAALAALRERYAGCLCLRCLSEFSDFSDMSGLQRDASRAVPPSA